MAEPRTTPDQSRVDPRADLSRLLTGGLALEIVRTAVSLSVPEAIGAGAADVDGLADRVGVPARRLIRLLRAMVSLGLCTQQTPRGFTLTPSGALLRGDVPDSLHALAKLTTASTTKQSVDELEYSIRTGEPGFDRVFGEPVFDYYAKDSELSAVFNAAMGQGTDGYAAAVAEHFDFGRFDSVTDVGGGNATLLAAILGSYPDLRGTVFDRAEGAALAPELLRAAGLADRGSVAYGDFFAAVPAGSQLYLLKSVLHDWNDEQAATILRNCRAVLPDDGRVLIVEPVLPEIAGQGDLGQPYLTDLNMLVLCGGQERTRADFDELCAEAGLHVVEVRPLARTGLCLIEAEPG